MPAAPLSDVPPTLANDASGEDLWQLLPSFSRLAC
ncbi:hypothetical protein SLEP1_g1177 [Rubroshorea leprosula]|uniref:Uncharacterized protein n=1 Tax=Rubroshorea leprosula TaxID=152421 RepID=A0AAV5HM26_9ROSI|nr:hypothetical protein SLEP1_g1177 [Rubroshorea leprosula]